MKQYIEHTFNGALAQEAFRLRELPNLTANSVIFNGKATGTVTLSAKRYGATDFETITDGVIDLAAGERGLDIFGAIVELKVVASVTSAYSVIIVQMEN